MPTAKPAATPQRSRDLQPGSAARLADGVARLAALSAEIAAAYSPGGPTAEPAQDPRPALSVVAPCFNEQDVLPLFLERMAAACRAAVGDDYEIVLVNDGSRDRTWEVIAAAAQTRPSIVGLNLARNHGHQLAVSAGLSLARGERVLLIDADLQDPPELLGEMMALSDAGHEVVYGRRRSRANESAFKLATADLFYRTLTALSDVSIPRDVGDFRLMSRRVVDRLNAMPEQDRFIRGMVAWLGGPQAEILYDRDARAAGSSGYTLLKMLKLAENALVSFSTAPLKLATILAFAGVMLGFGIVVYALIGFLTGHVNPGWTSLALMLVTFGIAQLGCLGIIGAYVGRTYMQVKGRPLFMIDEITTSSGAGPSAPPRC
jgi:glycosyltransferase involved in cell wall biosynthesis